MAKIHKWIQFLFQCVNKDSTKHEFPEFDEDYIRKMKRRWQKRENIRKLEKEDPRGYEIKLFSELKKGLWSKTDPAALGKSSTKFKKVLTFYKRAQFANTRDYAKIFFKILVQRYIQDATMRRSLRERFDYLWKYQRKNNKIPLNGREIMQQLDRFAEDKHKIKGIYRKFEDYKNKPLPPTQKELLQKQVEYVAQMIHASKCQEEECIIQEKKGRRKKLFVHILQCPHEKGCKEETGCIALKKIFSTYKEEEKAELAQLANEAGNSSAASSKGTSSNAGELGAALVAKVASISGKQIRKRNMENKLYRGVQDFLKKLDKQEKRAVNKKKKSESKKVQNAKRAQKSAASKAAALKKRAAAKEDDWETKVVPVFESVKNMKFEPMRRRRGMSVDGGGEFFEACYDPVDDSELEFGESDDDNEEEEEEEEEVDDSDDNMDVDEDLEPTASADTERLVAVEEEAAHVLCIQDYVRRALEAASVDYNAKNEGAVELLYLAFEALLEGVVDSAARHAVHRGSRQISVEDLHGSGSCARLRQQRAWCQAIVRRFSSTRRTERRRGDTNDKK
eukprot:g2649.t1